jgi:D-alanine-D-alanine ligase
MLNVCVLFGGDSVEHEISIISAQQAMAALDRSKYTVVPLYLAKNKQFYSSPALTDIAVFRDLEALVAKQSPVSVIRDNHKVFLTTGGLFPKKTEIDVVIPVVHGTHCEDGSIAGFLETLGIPYSGCDVLGGAVGQDKVVMKQILAHAGLPIVPWFWFMASEATSELPKIKAQALGLGYPVVVKPANLGSSVGITLVHTPEELEAAIVTAAQYDVKLLIEKGIHPLREINVSVLGYLDQREASVPEEVMKGDAILSYDNKYKGSSKSKGMASANRQCPANLSPELTTHIQDLAKSTFRELNSAGVARIDFLMNAETQAVYVNEINTIPGSLSFYLWEASGKPFSKLMDELVDIAIKRTRTRQKLIFSYTTNVLSSYQSGTKGSKTKTSR